MTLLNLIGRSWRLLLILQKQFCLEVKKLNLSQLESLNLATILEFRETVLLNLEYHLTIYCQNKNPRLA